MIGKTTSLLKPIFFENQYHKPSYPTSKTTCFPLFFLTMQYLWGNFSIEYKIEKKWVFQFLFFTLLSYYVLSVFCVWSKFLKNTGLIFVIYMYCLADSRWQNINFESSVFSYISEGGDVFFVYKKICINAKHG